MANMVTNVCVKFNYDRLRIDKALNWKSDNNKNKNNTKNNVRSTWGPFPSPEIGVKLSRAVGRILNNNDFSLKSAFKSWQKPGDEDWSFG